MFKIRKHSFFNILFLLAFASFHLACAQEDWRALNISEKPFMEKLSTGDFVLIDVRTEQELKQYKVGEPLHINYYDNSFKDKIASLDKREKYLLICKSSARSDKALKLMHEMGFEEVYALKGGIMGLSKRY
ncbi:MAG: rhodanese-like domain-containing protein [Cyclobacteriaceae bacterium]|nr:rhodanese-like domain-containing protein [Cyclobacteriaceae bacterium]MCH8517699.1 rhodanese-like domain-containing protein [Cyclobacteriaceae bacterium]